MFRSRSLTFTGLLIAAISLLSQPAAAHVDYVTEDTTTTASVTEVLRTVLTDPVSLTLLAGGAISTVALAGVYLAFSQRIPDCRIIIKTLESYRPYLPWILRLSIGLPLVGAAFGGYFFTPSVPIEARLLQTTLGFLILFGLATRFAAIASLVIYIIGLISFPDLILASEYVGGLIGIFILGSGQPSADLMLRRLVLTDGTYLNRFQRYHELYRRVFSHYSRREVGVAIRLFLGANFVYLGVAQKILEPASALHVVEKYSLTSVVPVQPELWVVGAGLTELLVGVLLILGVFSRGVAIAAFLLLTTTLFGLPDDPVIAHISLFGLSTAIMIIGSGPYSVDSTFLPKLRSRLQQGTEAS